ncbi:efflux RND transporter periplasmic adaptor subunit [Microbulbifer sp. OS29]|uniref:Efflux RND transporter periplasmic adaptor subunit n=1 Tax=Microbulbifer okhotskensis TaxID=2926617 RepID=A0A9X2EN71_9GAMM|nr:efflux RND transporter periplasmic adaptor subunit [Microbulbifer okhotskensis]MCO1334690.1 efflux RND transporter periplasmic adaptor subunit [Microbulbifer okhotskensis]
MKKLLAVIVVSLASGVAWAQGSPTAVTVDRAEMREIAPSQWSAGEVVSRRDILISSELDGVLEFVAEPGSFVKTGERLAELDSTHWRLHLRNSDSRIAQLRARLTYRDAQLSRLSKLAETNSTSRAALEEQQAEREAMAQDLLAAQIERDRRSYELSKTTIDAPFDTLVVSRQLQAGEYVRTGSELLRALDMSQMEVEADIPLTALPLIRVGDTVALRSDSVSLPGEARLDDKLFSGRVRQLVPVASDRSRRLKLMVTLPQSVPEQWDWIVGMPVQVSVPIAQPQATMSVPRDALVLRNGDTYVYRVGEGDKAERLSVRIGSGDGEWISVSGDLIRGDRVVVRGAERLQPGQEVKVLSEVVRDREPAQTSSGS